ncbi:hypothetical protein [Sutterella sp.]|uniref:hypothetical protein n=1 Tax=Sutterella sp. TaxID=1981025 RepID=UPI0026DF3BED|nr:hypothetical protein [Sutterella sp.]MDO5532084.1 hypothetical protein [Sutterella sp.]
MSNVIESSERFDSPGAVVRDLFRDAVRIARLHGIDPESAFQEALEALGTCPAARETTSAAPAGKDLPNALDTAFALARSTTVFGRILAMREFLAKEKAGAWQSASDNRIYYVAYARPVVAFWEDVENLCRALPAEFQEVLPPDFPERPQPGMIEKLGALGALAFIHRIVRAEHVRDGVFLAATEAGGLQRALDVLAGD